jgi:hypothetical protein
MSTKTTFKRIALVAVAALGLGVLSAVPSSAVVNADTLTVSSTTAAQTTAETATATSATTLISFLAGANNDSMSVTASLVSGPGTSTALPFLRLVETTSAIVDTVSATGLPVALGFSVSPNSAARVSNAAATAAQVSARFQVFLGIDSYTAPSVAGTYVVRLTPALSHTTTGSLNGTAQTITITVTKAASQDTTAASAYTHLTKGEMLPVPALAATDSTVSNSKDLVVSTSAGTLGVTLLNAAGGTVSAESYSVTITGAGILGSDTTGNLSTIAPVGRSIIVKNGNIVGIFADGTAGVGTITVSSAGGKVLATKTVSFYGAPAAIVLSQRRELAPNNSSEADVMRAQVFDALGYPVNDAVVYANSSDQSTIGADYVPYTTADVTSAGVTTSGLARIRLTGVKLGSARITVGLAKNANDVSTTGYAIKSDPLTIKVVGGPNQLGGVNVIMDKQSYTPGSYAWVTITPVDATGVKLAPETYTVFSSAGITTSQPVESFTALATAGSIGSTIWGQTVYTALSSNASTRTVADPVVELDGQKIVKIKLPNTEGDFTISWTTAAAANFPGKIAAGGVAGSITVTLSNPGSQAAVDAATEATDAANAATDAALAAADAADAATAAAEDASAAVAQLSKSVTTALNNLKKQITSLTALVNKLLKR